MTTASTGTVIAQTSNATFQAWVNEIYTNLVTNCGLTRISASMDSGQMAVPCVSARPAVSVAAGYYMLTFNDALGQGPLITGTALAAHIGGSGYDGGGSGTFVGVALTGGTGTGAIATVVVASGVISSITPTTAGANYNLGDQLIVTSAAMVTAGAAAGGGSSGFAFVAQLNATASPVLIKLEFGSDASGVTAPQMWITIGTSWTSNGVLGSAQVGAVTTRVAVCGGVAPVSTVTAYVSRYCYNSAYGFLGCVLKQGAFDGNVAHSLGGFIVFRASGNAGAAIGNSVALITNSYNNATNSVSAMQILSYTANLVYPTALTSGACSTWASLGNPYTGGNDTPFDVTSTLENGNIFVFPALMFDPVFRFSAVVGVVLINDIALGVTFQTALIGASLLTFLQVGLPFGGTLLGAAGSPLHAIVMLWQ